MTALPILCAASPATRPDTQTAAPLFTEDFESGSINPSVWTTQITGDNTITVQSDKVAHGRFALKVSCPVPANKTWAFLTMNTLPAELKQHHFGRVSMFITTQVPSRHTIFFMSGTPGFPNNKFQEIATANGRWQLTYVDLRPSGDKEDYHAGTDLPTGHWICLEWEFNDHPNHTTIWVDNKQAFETDFVSKTTGAKTGLIGSFTEYAFGLRLWGAAPAPFDVYYDDIAIGSSRFGVQEEPK